MWLLAILGRLLEKEINHGDDEIYIANRDVAMLLHTLLRAAQKSFSPLHDDIATEIRELTEGLCEQLGYVPTTKEMEAIENVTTLLMTPEWHD